MQLEKKIIVHIRKLHMHTWLNTSASSGMYEVVLLFDIVVGSLLF